MPNLLERIASVFRGPRPPELPAVRVIEQRADSSVFNPLTLLGGASDKGAVARPNPWVQPLTLQELDVLYEYNGIARRLVDIIPARACRRGWTVPEVGAEDSRLLTWAHVEQAMCMGRLYGGALLLPVTEDDVPPEFRSDPYRWLQQPLDLARVGRVEALQVFDATEASVVRYDQDVRSPNFRRPELWRLSAPGFSAVVHHSRLVYFPGNVRPPGRTRTGWTSTMPDSPVLQVIWDEIRRLTETMQGGAILAAEIRESVLKLGELAALAVGDEGAFIDERMRLIAASKGITGFTILGPNDSYENRSNPPTGFDQLSAAAWEALAAVTGIPQVILMGSTPGGLNTDGESSWEGFRQLVSSYQEHHRPQLERMYGIIRAAQDGPTGGRAADGELVFAALDEPNEATLSETRARVAETDKLYVDLGVYTAADVTAARFSPSGWQLDMLPVPVPEQVATDAKPYQDVGLPALTAAGIIGAATARQLLGLDESAAPSPAELAALAAAVGGNVASPRADAVETDSVCVLIPAAEPALRPAVEAAIGQALVVETEPHVTVLYLGTGLPPDAIAEVVQVVTDTARDADPSVLIGAPVLRAFPAGADGTPVVLEYQDAWPLGRLHDQLLTLLAHRISARQHPTYRPHLTLGYAPAALSPDQVAALLAIDTTGPELRVPLATVQVLVGPEVVATVQVGAGPEPKPDPVNEPNVPSGSLEGTSDPIQSTT